MLKNRKFVGVICVLVVFLFSSVAGLAASTIIDIKAKFDSKAVVSVSGVKNSDGVITYNGKNYISENVLNSVGRQYFTYSKKGNQYILETAEEQKARIAGKAISLVSNDEYSFPYYAALFDGVRTVKSFGDNTNISVSTGNKTFDYETGIKFANSKNTKNMLLRTYVGKLASSLVFELAASSDVSFNIYNGWTNTIIKKVSMKATESGMTFTIPLNSVDVFEIKDIVCSSGFTLGNPKIVLNNGVTKENVKAMEIDLAKFATNYWGLNIGKTEQAMNGLAPYGISYTFSDYIWSSKDNVIREVLEDEKIAVLPIIDPSYGFNTIEFDIVSDKDFEISLIGGDKSVIGSAAINASTPSSLSFSTKNSEVPLPLDLRIIPYNYYKQGYTVGYFYTPCSIYNIKVTRK